MLPDPNPAFIREKQAPIGDGCLIGVGIVLGIGIALLSFYMGYVFDHARFEQPSAPTVRPFSYGE